MNSSDTREKWLKIHEQLELRAEAFKDCMSVPFGMLDIYDAFSAEEKTDILPMLAEWLMSDNGKLRYDATFLASERRIRELAPAVQMAIEKWSGVPGPEARDQVKKLRRIQGELA